MPHKRQGVIALKTKFGYRPLNSLSSVTYVFPFELETCDPVGLDFESIEVTSLESDGKEAARGLAERKASVSFYFDASNTLHVAMLNDLVFTDSPDHDFAIVLPNGAMFTGQGFVSSYKPSQVSAKDVFKVGLDLYFNTGPVLVAAPTQGS